MAAIRPNYKVRRLRLDDIAEKAYAWRKADGRPNEAYFNIVDFVSTTLKQRLRDADLEIKLFEMQVGQDPAYVTFDRPARFGKRVITLNIDREIWELAKIGDPEARFIVAHEIGHIVLHDHDAKAFSEDDGSRSTQFEKEETAEWQADTFALCFLMPARIVIGYDRADKLATATAVEKKHALKRFDVVIAANTRFAAHTGYPCPGCGDFKMSRQGIEMKCECGFSMPTC